MNLSKELARAAKKSFFFFFHFLGMRLDEFLTWEFHMKHVCNIILRANFALNRVKHAFTFIYANLCITR